MQGSERLGENLEFAQDAEMIAHRSGLVHKEVLHLDQVGTGLWLGRGGQPSHKGFVFDSHVIRLACNGSWSTVHV